MDNSKKFAEYREKYKDFYYNSYKVKEDKQGIDIEYEFEIPEFAKFHPRLKILRKKFNFKRLDSNYVKNMVFHIGLIELISYWKATCSPNVVVKCGYLNEEQKKWWKKIYFYGLGELFFVNKIKTNIDDFMNIKCIQGKNEIEYEQIKDDSSGYIVPIGGGKDSVVTLETLKVNKESDYCFIINPKEVTLKCAEIAGISNDNIIEVYRTIDENLIELNKQGYINGHTPFSAMLAFTSYFIAYLLSKKYIAVSNENSANEANVKGEKTNHQYSKSFEFECDFEDYAGKYLKAPVKYFSFLRPLNELQIAKIFSRLEKYHSTFKSCNVGSKEKEWKWCCKCAKCLFAYIILSPYLYKEKLINIFGTDLFEDEELLNTFLELTGNGETKPFECVGTFEEVNFAISKTIENLENERKVMAKMTDSFKGKQDYINKTKDDVEEDVSNSEKENLPYLLKYYKENIGLVDTKEDITLRYNAENNLTEEQNEMLRKEVFLSDK